MKLIKPSWIILEQKPGLQGIYEQIELAGRTCYKSERKKDTTAKDFVDRMISSKHYSMLEHGTVYLMFYGAWDVTTSHEVEKYINNPYSKVVGPIYDKEDYKEGERQFSTAYITTNMRVLVENNWLDDLQTNIKYNKCYLCEPTEFHEKRITVRFITDIGISREFNRHRVNSMAEQSTRYCNYSTDKFNNELSIILPNELSDPELVSWLENNDEFKFKRLCQEVLDDNMSWGILQNWLFANLACEYSYMKLLGLGWKPEQARRILPLDTKTELIHTAYISDWRKFFNLRAIGTTGRPHPDASVLAEPLMNEFKKRRLI